VNWRTSRYRCYPVIKIICNEHGGHSWWTSTKSGINGGQLSPPSVATWASIQPQFIMSRRYQRCKILGFEAE